MEASLQPLMITDDGKAFKPASLLPCHTEIGDELLGTLTFDVRPRARGGVPSFQETFNPKVKADQMLTQPDRPYSSGRDANLGAKVPALNILKAQEIHVKSRNLVKNYLTEQQVSGKRIEQRQGDGAAVQKPAFFNQGRLVMPTQRPK